jgi:hypothetical protein
MSSRSVLDQMLPRPGARERPRRAGAWLVLRVVLAVVAAALGGLAVVVGAAAVSDRPVAFLGAGLVAFLAVIAAGVAWATRRVPGEDRRRVRLAGFAAAALAGLVLWATVLVPVPTPGWPRPRCPASGSGSSPPGRGSPGSTCPPRARPDPPRWCSCTAAPASPTWPGTPPTSANSPATATTSGCTTRSAPAAPAGWPTPAATPSPAASPT